MDTAQCATKLLYFNSGHPFHTSYLCNIFDEDIIPERNDDTWKISDVEDASQQILFRANTNFESLIKNLENNPELYELVFDLICETNNKWERF